MSEDYADLFCELFDLLDPTEFRAEGEAWMGDSVWQDRAAIRISVSCWRTDADDVRRTIDAFARAASAHPQY